jgi:hypothetical protein
LLWPDLRAAFAWVHRAAHILTNPEERSAPETMRSLRSLLGAMARHQEKAGTLAPALKRFRKVTRSYWPGLFHCYAIAGLPRTNNDLEHFFGTSRHHERRATGRRSASPALVLRGSVRLVAAAATRLRARTGAELQPRDPARWRHLRHELETRRCIRRYGVRFRRNPQAYLRQLEADLLRLALPS